MEQAELAVVPMALVSLLRDQTGGRPDGEASNQSLINGDVRTVPNDATAAQSVGAK